MTGDISFKSLQELAEFVANLSEQRCNTPFNVCRESGYWVLRFTEK
jgi:hypothetical protein